MSTTQITYHAKGVFFTETGARKVREFLATQEADLSVAGLRVGVRGGGCSGFQVNNPNVVAACGCGSSFRVAEDEQVSAV